MRSLTRVREKLESLAEILREAHERAVHPPLWQDFDARILILQVDGAGQQIARGERLGTVSVRNRIGRQEGSRVENVARAAAHAAMVRAAESSLVGIRRIGTSRSVERTAIGVLIRQQHVAAVPARAVELRKETLFRATRRRAESHLRLGAVEILAHDDVDDARDRIRSVQRGCAVGQHLDVIDRAPWNPGEIDEIRFRAGIGLTSAVHQHQRCARAESTKIHG